MFYKHHSSLLLWSSAGDYCITTARDYGHTNQIYSIVVLFDTMTGCKTL